MKDKIRTHIALGRHFAAPIVILAVILGAQLGGSPVGITILAVIAGLLAMSAGHYYNSWADHNWGLDRGEVRSTAKWYTWGSSVIALGKATPKEVLTSAIVQYIAFTAICAYIGWAANTWWILFPWLIAMTAGFMYAPGFMPGLKYKGFPEYVGFAFGIGGVSLGYVCSGAMDLSVVLLVGIGCSLPWAAAWIIDQYVDAESDIPKGVRNIAHVAFETGFPIWGWCLFGWTLSYVFLLFLITIGYLSPWVFLAMFAVPLFGLCIVWLPKDITKGVQYGLMGIFVYMLLIVIGQAIGG